MHVAHLALADYRSYVAVDLPLDPGVTSLIGPNGQGKTNLVEAVGYLSSLGSHRVATDAPLVRIGAERAVIRASVQREGRATLLEVEVNPGRANRARLNKAPVPRPREILGSLRTVLFAPEDLALVRGDPGERRRYLDDLLVARTPRYAGVRQDYDRILKQRNALLKSAGAKVRSGGGDVRTLDVWDEHLARTGAELLAARMELTRDLRPLVGKAYASVAPEGDATAIEYRSSLVRDADGPAAGEELPSDRAALEQLMLAALATVRRAELERGVSLVGPHRDDLVLRLGPMPAKGYASHGESWSYALALRLASYDLLVGDGQAGGEPVLILDDVFAELDTQRRNRLAELVAGAEQVLVTAAVPQDVPSVLQGSRVDVADGQVSRAR